MKKRLLTLSLASLLVISSLTGCGGQKVTAQSLLDGAYGNEKIKSVDMDIALNVDADVDTSNFLGETDTESVDEIDPNMQVYPTESTPMNFKIALDANAKANEKVAYIDGNVDLNLFGFSQKIPTKSYSDLDNNVIYTYNENSDSWTKTENKSSKIDFEKINTKLSNDVFEDLKLEDSKKDDSVYTVTGTISMDKLKDLYGDVADDILDTESDTLDMSKMKFDVKMTFDKDSKLIKSMDYTIDSSSLDSDQYTINDFSISIVFNQFNGVNVSIPDDVVNNATDSLDSEDFE